MNNWVDQAQTVESQRGCNTTQLSACMQHWEELGKVQSQVEIRVSFKINDPGIWVLQQRVMISDGDATLKNRFNKLFRQTKKRGLHYDNAWVKLFRKMNMSVEYTERGMGSVVAKKKKARKAREANLSNFWYGDQFGVVRAGKRGGPQSLKQFCKEGMSMQVGGQTCLAMINPDCSWLLTCLDLLRCA